MWKCCIVQTELNFLLRVSSRIKKGEKKESSNFLQCTSLHCTHCTTMAWFNHFCPKIRGFFYYLFVLNDTPIFFVYKQSYMVTLGKISHVVKLPNCCFSKLYLIRKFMKFWMEKFSLIFGQNWKIRVIVSMCYLALSFLWQHVSDLVFKVI